MSGSALDLATAQDSQFFGKKEKQQKELIPSAAANDGV
jgi:hypothetical protein